MPNPTQIYCLMRAGTSVSGLAALLLLTACAEQPTPSVQDRMLSHAESICPTTADLTQPAADSAFGQNLVKEISSKAFYPQEAFDSGQQGRVVLCLHYLADGHQDRVLVQESSGYPALDGAALYATGLYAAEQGDTPTPLGTRINSDKQAHPRRFPPLPPELLAGRDSVWLSAPVVFKPANPAEMAAKTQPENVWQPDIGFCNGLHHRESAAANSAQEAPAGSITPILSGFRDRYIRNVFFPKQAQTLRIEGSAELRFAIEDGVFQCGMLSRSSGSPLFDGVALLALAYTAQDPAQAREFKEIPGKHALIALPINFKNHP